MLRLSLWCAAALLGLCISAQAADRKVIREIYSEVPAQYLYPLPVSKLAVYFLKGLNEVDRQLQVGDDRDKLTLYYRGQIIKSLYKPKDDKDIEAWVELTAELMDLAAKKSAKAAKHDFELADLLMAGAMQYFDEDSKFYLNPQDEQGKRQKHQRNFVERRTGDYLYLRIGAFNAYTKDNIEQSIGKHSDIKGLVLDLRGSPGGMLSEGIEAADLFLDDLIIASSRGRKGSEEVYYNAEEGDILHEKPIVVLIDGDTASAAEVLAAALQEQNRALVIGTNSKGKGSIQTLVNLSDGATIALTSAYFYSPSGYRLHGLGVTPNICTFEMPETKNVDNLLALPRNYLCLRESRAGKALDEEAALAVLRQNTAKTDAGDTATEEK